MQAAALEGVCTLIDDPQNLLIAETAGWQFADFIVRTSPGTIPVLAAGLLTVIFLKNLKVFGYGATITENTYKILVRFNNEEKTNNRI